MVKRVVLLKFIILEILPLNFWDIFINLWIGINLFFSHFKYFIYSFFGIHKRAQQSSKQTHDNSFVGRKKRIVHNELRAFSNKIHIHCGAADNARTTYLHKKYM